VTRSVIRHITWTIAPDPFEGASPSLYEVECTTCPARSPASEEAAEVQQRALEHSGRHPSHTGFRRTHTSFWRPSMADGSRTS
jgi:hypothetical protein